MTYEEWRISFQDSEQAARAAFRAWQEAEQGAREPAGFMFEDDFERLSTTECCVDIYSVEAGHPDKGQTTVKLYAHPPKELIRFDFHSDGRVDSKVITHEEMRRRYADLLASNTLSYRTTPGVPDGWFAEVQDGQLCIVNPEGWSIAWAPHPKGNSHQDIAGRLVIAMLDRQPAEQEADQ